MSKIAAAVATALFVTASPLAYAQTAVQLEHPVLTAENWNKLTDLRIDLVKAALQLTPDQTKYWPPIENAIRARAKDRQARVAKAVETMGKRADDVTGNRDPIAFLNGRADALAQRSADLKNLAAAWQPLYQTLSQDQKNRLGALALFVLHDLSDAVERHRAQADEEE